MLESLRERLLSVQQDLSSGLKIFSDKSRETKINKQRTAQNLPEFSAGLVLLSRYEDSWAALHKGAKECAKTGEVGYLGNVCMIKKEVGSPVLWVKRL